MTEQDGTAADPFARALFTAISVTRDLRGAGEEAAGMRSFSELAHSLLRPDGNGAGEVLDRAFGDPDRAATVDALLRRMALAEFPTAAAASGGGFEMREHGGFRLRLEPSLAVDGPTYLLIERMRPETALPRLLVAVPPDARPVYVVLPEADTLPIQLILDAETPFLRAFRDPDSRLYLT